MAIQQLQLQLQLLQPSLMVCRRCPPSPLLAVTSRATATVAGARLSQ